MINENRLHKICNEIGLAVVCVILLIAFADQFYQYDLPCPLCLLQRVSFIAVGVGLCMNLNVGIRPSHYGLMVLAALLGFATAVRQLTLHISPGDLGYGHMLFGFHLYTWSAIAFSITIAFISFAMLLERGFVENKQNYICKKHPLIVFFLILILANGISTFIECGVSTCPANPVHYKLLN